MSDCITSSKTITSITSTDNNTHSETRDEISIGGVLAAEEKADGSYGYWGGDEAGLTSSEEISIESNHPTAANLCGTKNDEQSRDEGAINENPPAQLEADREQDAGQLEEVADTDDNAEELIGGAANQENLDAQNHDEQSSNDEAIEDAEFTEVTSNLKRRRIYPFGRFLNAWV